MVESYAPLIEELFTLTKHNIGEMPKDFTPERAKEVIEVILHQEDEEVWRQLPINAIQISKSEMNLWDLFSKKGWSEFRSALVLDNLALEKGVPYEFEVEGLDFCSVTKIRKEEKDGFSFCRVEIRLGKNQSRTDYLVRIRNKKLEIYRNKPDSIQEIKAFPIVRVYERETQGKKELGLMKVLLGN